MKTQAWVLLALFCLIAALVQGFTLPKVCTIEPDERPCGNQPPSIARWYYDVRYGYCGRFRTGGCSGNGNSFSNCTACMRFCTSHPEPEELCRQVIGAP
uniref:Putative monolaris n=1 Tax=Amblyomma parvum TaxID=251391 RepID=A0A023G0I2_AMBPA